MTTEQIVQLLINGECVVITDDNQAKEVQKKIKRNQKELYRSINTTKRKIMNTTENNKLLAEFLGWESHFKNGATTIVYIDDKQYTQDWEYLDKEKEMLITPIEMKFDTSFDWIMQVVEKIESLKDKQGCTFFVEISKERVHIKYYYKNEEFSNIFIHNYNGRTKIETVYNACVEFVKFYNENK